ncbi:MAG: right-handed parallel beta-helix repeat-containing protein [Thermoplasmata archaeon]|nr:MAG: right-handed parallel beta-helix repeat-containing protein [Thermoplasmata archaeon]
MKRKITSIVLCSILILSTFIILDFKFGFVEVVEGETFYVNTTGSNGAYTSIQDAINASKDGDTVFVYNGTYYENVVVNKSISLVGEDSNSTIINGWYVDDVVLITRDYVNLTGFTCTLSGSAFEDAGIELNNVSMCNITGNNIIQNYDDGIYLYNSSNNIITNNNVTDNNYGINLKNSFENTIAFNIASDNSRGIFLSYSDRNIITNNTVYSNHGNGIQLSSSNRNNITSNNIISNIRAAIYIGSSVENNFTDNIMMENGFDLLGDQIEYWNSHDIDTSNTVNGKPVQYLKNQVGGTIPAGSGQVILGNCTGIKVDNQNLTNGSIGIILGFSSNNSIINNNVSSNRMYGISLYYSNSNLLLGNNGSLTKIHHGFNLHYSDFNNITQNTLYSNTKQGMELYYSDYNNITGNQVGENFRGIYILISVGNNISKNTIIGNSFEGISLTHSDGNNVSSNNGTGNGYGIALSYSEGNTIVDNNISPINGTGIFLSNSHDNLLRSNNASNNKNGIYMGDSHWNSFIDNSICSNSEYGIHMRDSDRNTIANNNISNNSYRGIYQWYADRNQIIGNNISYNYFGLEIWTSESNYVYHNNIINNTTQGLFSPFNYMDNGYPMGGNYWSDYNGSDGFKGPNQNIPGVDGIGDTPHEVDYTYDDYPLMEPYQYKPLENYTVLQRGWNLISIPLIQEEQNLIRVLGSIDGWYDIVQWYDSSDQSDQWKHNKIDKPFGNDLFELNETMGFWVRITYWKEIIFAYNGTLPTENQTIVLNPGWNLVGYPSLTNYDRTEGLNKLKFGIEVDAIWSYNASSQKWDEMGESDYFEVGKGYYIHAKTECEWEVPL